MGIFDREKSIYLIDSENVSGEWTEKIKDCKDPDEIYIFYSDNSKRTSMKQDQVLADAEKNGAKVERIECGIGNNALDFQLSSHLGFCISDNKKNAKAKYYIVSNDKGYDPLIPYWFKEVEADIKRETVVTVGDLRAASISTKNSNNKKTAQKSAAKTAQKSAQKNKADIKKQEPKKQEVKKSEPKKQEPKKQEVKKSEPKQQDAVKETSSNTAKWVAPKNDMDYAIAIGRSLKVTKKEQYHHLLVQILGQKKADTVFSELKKDKDASRKAEDAYLQDLTKRQENIIRLFLYHERKKSADTKKILTIIRRVPEEDKTMLHKEFVETFGNDLGTEYHNLFKGSLKIIKRL